MKALRSLILIFFSFMILSGCVVINNTDRITPHSIAAPDKAKAYVMYSVQITDPEIVPRTVYFVKFLPGIDTAPKKSCFFERYDLIDGHAQATHTERQYIVYRVNPGYYIQRSMFIDSVPKHVFHAEAGKISYIGNYKLSRSETTIGRYEINVERDSYPEEAEKALQQFKSLSSRKLRFHVVNPLKIKGVPSQIPFCSL